MDAGIATGRINFMDDLNCNFYYEPPKQIREISKKRRKLIESIGGRVSEDDSDVSFDIEFNDGSGRFIKIDYLNVPDDNIVKYTIMKIYLNGFDSGINNMKETTKDFLDKNKNRMRKMYE